MEGHLTMSKKERARLLTPADTRVLTSMAQIIKDGPERTAGSILRE